MYYSIYTHDTLGYTMYSILYNILHDELIMLSYS